MRLISCSFVLCATLMLVVPAALADASGIPPAAPSSDEATTTYDLGWHAIAPGISQARSSCFLLSATAGQPAPGYSAGGSYIVTSGFWSAAPTTGLDEVFFNGFEGCGP